VSATDLHFYQCSLCKTVMCSVLRDSHRPCNGCLRWMKFLYSTPIRTDEQRAWARLGTVFNPRPPLPEQWRCVRCGETFTNFQHRYRLDGKCCVPCVQAESVPPLLTPAEQAASKAKTERLIQQDIDRQEAAYVAAEARKP
jgi:hypothetical protein